MWTFILWLGFTALSFLLRPKPPEPKPASVEDFEFPTAQEGRPIPVVFGTVWISGPNVVWYGDLDVEAITESDGGLFGTGVGAHEYTVGYYYYAGAHLVLCHGPVDWVQEIQVDERTAWNIPSPGGLIAINKPDLFGGKKGEGGIVGPVYIHMGHPAQIVDPYLLLKLGAPLPAFRRVVSLVWYKIYVSANSPYIKPWRVKVTRTETTAGGADIWYKAKADLLGHLNPAHIVYDCLTNLEWGRGLPTTEIDEASFIAAADTLFAEGFGLSLQWSGQESLQAFIDRVLRHIDGRLGQSPTTGHYTLTLIRDDYVPANLPLLDESVILEVDEFERRSYADLPNELVVQYANSDTGKPRALTVHNLAGIQISGGVISQTLHYPAIHSDQLAAQVALRDLRLLSTPLSRVRLRVNRTAYALQPGNPIRLSWARLGISEVVYRVTRISYGELTDGAITLDLTEDAFQAAGEFYIGGAVSEWVDSLIGPQAVTTQTAIEAPYWTIARGLAPADLAELASDYGFAALIPQNPQAFAYGYRLISRESPDPFEARGEHPFCPTATLLAGVDGDDTLLILANVDNLDRVQPGSWALLGTELVAVTDVDTEDEEVTVERAVLDTCPVTHSTGTRIWFAEPVLGLDSTEWSDGDTVDLRALTRTGLGTLGESAALNAQVTLDQRAQRPYAPGKIRINTEAWPTSLTGDLAITWAHRDRTQQLDAFVGQDADSIGPEAGTTYTIYVYDTSTETLKHTESGLSGTSWTYTQTQRESDFGGGGPHAVRIEIEAVRSSLASWQRQNRSFSVT